MVTKPDKENIMTHQDDYTLPQDLAEKGLESIPELVRVLINQAMQAERAKYLNARQYERTEDRKGHANGYKPKTVRTRVGEITFAVPQVREGGFYPSALEKGLRSERALVIALAEMYVQGVSTRKVKAITEELCGVDVSSMQVSRAAAQLDGTLQEWRERPLGEITYLYVDARYEKVREAGQVRDAAVLVASGITPEGERQVLGVSVSLSEHETHWKAFLKGLKDRGMNGVKLVTSDDHQGELCWAVSPGNDASSTSSKMLEHTCPNNSCAWKWLLIFAPCSTPQIDRQQRHSCNPPSRSTLSLHHACRPGWRKTYLKDLRSSIFLWTTGAPSGRPTAWNGSTKRSAGAPGWSVSFQTKRLAFA
jgi:hypothetical protein